jgi:hypothetical protein
VSDISREQFASSVSATLFGVHHLYRELHRLIAGLRDALKGGSSPLGLVVGNTPGRGRDETRLIVRNEYGLLLGPLDAEEDSEEEAEDEDPEENLDLSAKPGRRRTPPIEIDAGEPLLALRLAIYDPRTLDAFEPHLAYAVLGDWAVGNAAPGVGRILVSRRMLKRVPRVLSPRGAPGERVWTDATVKSATGGKIGRDRRLTCRVMSVPEMVPLFALDTAEELDRLAERVAASWAGAAQPKPGVPAAP